MWLCLATVVFNKHQSIPYLHYIKLFFIVKEIILYIVYYIIYLTKLQRQFGQLVLDNVTNQFWTGQCSQNVDVNGPHHRYFELIVSSSFNKPMAVERGRSHELVGSMMGAVYVHVLRTLGPVLAVSTDKLTVSGVVVLRRSLASTWRTSIVPARVVPTSRQAIWTAVASVRSIGP